MYQESEKHMSLVLMGTRNPKVVLDLQTMLRVQSWLTYIHSGREETAGGHTVGND